MDFRILALERAGDDREVRMRVMERQIVELNEKLGTLPAIRDSIRQLYNDRYKNLFGFILVLATVIGTFIFNQFVGVHLK